MKLRLIFFLCSFLTSVAAFAQSKSSFPQYRGGLDSLNRYLFKNLSKLPDLDREYFMFVRILILDNGVITVSEIFNKQDSSTMKITEVIRRSSSSWIMAANSNNTILLPVYITADKDSDKGFKMMYHTTTSQDYLETAEPVEGLLLPPFVMFRGQYHYPGYGRSQGLHFNS